MVYSVTEVVTYDTYANLPSAGAAGVVYFAADRALYYVWNGSAYVANSAGAPRITSVASSATPTIDCTLTDLFEVTTLTTAITGVTVTGTPYDGQPLDIRIKSDSSVRAIAFGSSFTGTLLTTTVASKTHLQRVKYDAAAAKWAGYYADTAGY